MFAYGTAHDKRVSDSKSHLFGMPKIRVNKEKSVKAIEAELKEEDLEKSGKTLLDNSECKCKHVAFNEKVSAIDGIVNDDNNALEVWTVYSPVAYVTRKQQRVLQKQCAERARVLRKACSSMFAPAHDLNKDDKGMETSPSFFQSTILRRSKSSNETVKLINSTDFASAGYGEYHLACLYFVMSLWPAIPVDVRPPLIPPVELSMEALFKNTQLCIFNNVPEMPVCCTAALRLLRNGDGEEGCIAIYNLEDTTSLDAHIPLASLHHLELGLQKSEIEHYVNDLQEIVCRVPSSTTIITTTNNNTITVNYAHSLTLHCEMPQKFYISFVALNEQSFLQWTNVLQYFAQHNAKCSECLANSVLPLENNNGEEL